MVSHHNLLPSSDGAKAVNSPINDVELTQCWIGEESGLRIAIGNYQRGSLTGQIRSMNRKEIGEVLEAMVEYLTN